MVSIIVPVYNSSKYIRTCLESLLGQTCQDLEIILVDDCGQDNSMDIVREYAAKDNRVVVIESDANRGPMKARENGYMQANGEYLMFVDSDDYMPFQAVELLVRKAQETGADIVAGNYVRVSSTGRNIQGKVSLPYGDDKEDVLRALLGKKLVQTLWGKLYRAELFKNYKYETLDNMKNGEDAYLFYQIVNNVKRVVCVPEHVYYYVENPNSSTQSRLPITQVRNIAKLNRLRLEVCKPYPELEPIAERLVTGVLADLYAQGLCGKEVAQILQEEGLEQYCSLSRILQTLSISELCAIAKNAIVSKIRK